MSMVRDSLDHPPAVRAAVLDGAAGVSHGFFGRRGGVSTGIYASLNAGPGSDDAPAAVAENRQRIAAAFALAPERLLTAHQVHSAEVTVVDGPWPGPPPQVDALVTRTPGLALGVLSADCAPLLFADVEAGVIGAAHAGWKGALAGVAEATLAAMQAEGAAPERIGAAIGPCISRAEYEVGPEFLARFVAADPANERWFAADQGDRSHFDLKGYLASRLANAGVRRVEVLADCTCADAGRYFSNRRRNRAGEADYGRNLSAIVLAPQA